MGKKELLDKFYTKDWVVDFLLVNVDLTYYDLIIEPSAGAGAFSTKLDCIALDILPEGPNILEQDFLTYEVPQNYDTVLIIGNPPFGVRNKLSKAFISHALKFENVKTIAFVLPNVYNKHTNQSIFPARWKLIQKICLPLDSFTLKGQPYNVPCTFFVWTRLPIGVDLRFDVDKYKYNPYFSYCAKEEADFFMFGAAPKKIIKPSMVNSNNRGYYIKPLVPNLADVLSTINWSGNSSASGGVSWFTKYELNKICIEHFLMSIEK